jgi:hypothetical protein
MKVLDSIASLLFAYVLNPVVIFYFHGGPPCKIVPPNLGPLGPSPLKNLKFGAKF